jgi:hypothetical protein
MHEQSSQTMRSDLIRAPEEQTYTLVIQDAAFRARRAVLEQELARLNR